MNVNLTVELPNIAGRPLGSLRVDIRSEQPGQDPPSFSEVRAAFQVLYPAVEPSLITAARALGGHHFNWYQVVLAGERDDRRVASRRQRVAPRIDPPCNQISEGITNDSLPWYWDELPFGKPGATTRHLNRHIGWSEGRGPAPGTPELYEVFSDGDTLAYVDQPQVSPGGFVDICTWLVCVGEDGRAKEFFPGFAWKASGAEHGSVMVELTGPIARGPNSGEYDELVASGPGSDCWYRFS